MFSNFLILINARKLFVERRKYGSWTPLMPFRSLARSGLVIATCPDLASPFNFSENTWKHVSHMIADITNRFLVKNNP